jgi:hypothetical protein
MTGLVCPCNWRLPPPVSSPKPETRIIACKRFGIHTRHEREGWIQRPLFLLLLTGRVKLITAWRCTKCGKYRSARTRYAKEERIVTVERGENRVSKTTQRDVDYKLFEQAGTALASKARLHCLEHKPPDLAGWISTIPRPPRPGFGPGPTENTRTNCQPSVCTCTHLAQRNQRKRRFPTSQTNP